MLMLAALWEAVVGTKYCESGAAKARDFCLITGFSSTPCATLVILEQEIKQLFVDLKKLEENDFEDLEVKVEKICCEFCEKKFFIPANLDLHVKQKTCAWNSKIEVFLLQKATE